MLVGVGVCMHTCDGGVIYSGGLDMPGGFACFRGWVVCFCTLDFFATEARGGLSVCRAGVKDVCKQPVSCNLSPKVTAMESSCRSVHNRQACVLFLQQLLRSASVALSPSP